MPRSKQERRWRARIEVVYHRISERKYREVYELAIPTKHFPIEKKGEQNETSSRFIRKSIKSKAGS